MSVCIAAIFQNLNTAGVMMVTDRLRTDMTTLRRAESTSTKAHAFSNHVVALVADDMALQSEICRVAKDILNERFGEEALKEKHTYFVIDVVDAYEEAYIRTRQNRIERNILARFGLTYKMLQDNPEAASAADKELLFDQIIRFKMEGTVSTIIAGTDKDGSHIWVVDDNDRRCETDRGFAAVGSGASDAEAQIELGGYRPNLELAELNLLLYVAKKRSERVEGVGEATDMFITWHEENALSFLKWEDQEPFAKEYERMERDIRKIEERSRQRLRLKIDEKARQNIEKALKEQGESPISEESDGTHAAADSASV